MENNRLRACCAMVGDANGPRLVYATNQTAFIIDVENRICLGHVPVEADTDERIAIGQVEGACVVGSWKAGLRAWDYRSCRVLWTSAINELDYVNSFGRGAQLKVSKRGTHVLDATDGRIIKVIPRWDVYSHPWREATAAFDPLHRKVVITVEGTSGVVSVDSFGILSHAWGPDEFVWGTPTGHLLMYRLSSRRLVLNTKPKQWFNIPDLCFNETTGTFCGLASDWQGRASLALFSLSPETAEIKYLVTLANEPQFCFLDNGRLLALADGTIYRASDGSQLQRIDWDSMGRGA